MATESIHRFELDGHRYAIDPETCFCFECDEISWDVLEHFPHTPLNRIYHLLGDRYDLKELCEVAGELEWLRATKSILVRQKPAAVKDQFDLTTGLKRLTIVLPGGTPDADLVQQATALLFNRSEKQPELELQFRMDQRMAHGDFIIQQAARAQKGARLAGKKLTVAVSVANIALKKAPPALEGHTLSATLELADADDAMLKEAIEAFAKSGTENLARLSKILQPRAGGVSGRFIVRPNHAEYGDAVEALDKAGFKTIELDLEGAYVANAGLAPDAMLPGLQASARYYAGQLLKNHYFRLDPIAALFWRIYDGNPLRRHDSAGTHELAVDGAGDIYPSVDFIGKEEFKAGSIGEGKIDNAVLGQFEDMGVATTGPCRRCWARSLCGGGSAAVNEALSGHFHKPNEAWCDAQRAWCAGAVSAFNALSSANVNFSRVYTNLQPNAKPSLFSMVKAALRMTVILRPVEESDAPMLTQWENWRESAYFLNNETGILLATQYDREMDSLHPQSIDQEMVLIRKSGDPIGLIKFRPDGAEGAAWSWIYMHNEEDYAAADVRKGFKALLQEAGKQQNLRRLVVGALASETGLHDFLESIGFAKAGIQREAVYLHNSYRDVHLYSVALGKG
jgi:uncharacterized protein